MVKCSSLNRHNILVIGETGSGKSTLINYLTNYFKGGSLEEPKIAIPTKHYKATEEFQSSELDLHDVTKSKTSECTTYGFKKSSYLYNFIDTPGLSDTEGTEKDDQHIEKIMDAVDRTGSMTAIIIVINGTVARATVNLRNTLTRLRGSVPDILLNNLILVLTNCSVSSSNFNLESLEGWTVSDENVFYMNNSALSKPKDLWINDNRRKAGLLNDWQESMKELNSMMMKVKDLDAVATDVFGEIRKKRDDIKTGFAEILLVLEWMQDMEDKVIEFDSRRWSSGTEVLMQKVCEIRKCCRQLKLICKGFNFVDELKCVIGIMKTHARAIKTVEARNKADKMIENIQLFADNFVEE